MRYRDSQKQHEEGDKMKMRIIAIMMAVMFALPVSAVLSAPAGESTSAPVTVIPKSQFNIVLDANEKVIWMADQVACDSDVAYVTLTVNQQPTIPSGDALPLALPYWRSYTICARSPIGLKMFDTQAGAWFLFILTYLVSISDASSQYVYPGFRWKYEAMGTDMDNNLGDYPQSGTEYAWGHFKNKITGGTPQIYAWCTCQSGGYSYGGGSYTPG